MSALRVLLISPYFPPSTLAGVHRARLLAKHLPQFGWEPIVLCVDERSHEQRLDPGLAALVPADREIVKVSALPIRLTRPFGLGEISLRAWLPLRRKLSEIMATREIDVVFITGSPFYPMLFAREVKEKFGIPVVLDFQDPWVSAWGAQQRWWSKAGLSHRIATWFEPYAVRDATFITSVSQTQNLDMVGRYPWLGLREKMAAIPIGGDPSDFEQQRRSKFEGGSAYLDPEKINLSYVGTFMPRTREPVRALFQGLRRVREQSPELARRIRLNFIGTSNQPNDNRTFRILPLSAEEGVSDNVFEVPQRVPYLDALNVLVHSSGLLLIGSDEPHYTASKIYPALMSGTPYLSLFYRTSSAHEILSAAGGGVALSFDSPEALARAPPALAEGLVRLATDPAGLGRADHAAYQAYEAKSVARAYADIFQKVRGSV